MHALDRAAGSQGATRLTAGLFIWTLAWVVTLALAKFGPTHIWDSQAAVSWAAIATNVAAGIGWIIAHARYLRGVDELQGKIMQDALTVTLGLAWVGGFAYVVADAADLIDRDINIAVFPALLAVVYMISVAAGHLRYR